MTVIDWLEFFRIICRHRQGHGMTLSYEAAVNHPGQDNLARVLFMVPVPVSEAMGITAQAEEWMEGDAA